MVSKQSIWVRSRRGAEGHRLAHKFTTCLLAEEEEEVERRDTFVSNINVYLFIYLFLNKY